MAVMHVFHDYRAGVACSLISISISFVQNMAMTNLFFYKSSRTGWLSFSQAVNQSRFLEWPK